MHPAAGSPAVRTNFGAERADPRQHYLWGTKVTLLHRLFHNLVEKRRLRESELLWFGVAA
jgi:hypothetical protein